VSIGGTLTPYAAPPVLMVANQWGWDLAFMFTHFGWKALLAVVISTSIITLQFRKELIQIDWKRAHTERGMKIPGWVYVLHLIFLFLVVIGGHHMVVFMGAFLFFLGLVNVTREY